MTFSLLSLYERIPVWLILFNFNLGSLFSYSKYYSECHTVEVNYGGEISNLAALWFTYPNAHRMVNLLLLLLLVLRRMFVIYKIVFKYHLHLLFCKFQL